MRELERRYTSRRAKVAHLFDPIEHAGLVSVALCGLWAWHEHLWRGTGSQDEYERAASLPTCKNCARRVAS
jgi:hypothetical protein